MGMQPAQQEPGHAPARFLLLAWRVSFGAIVFLALGLAMDATAVSAARGAAAERVRARDVVLVAGAFAVFHAVMPTLGWIAGSQLGSVVETWDHWLAFAILGVIGVRMILQSLQRQVALAAAPFAPTVILGLALATSLDALAIGVTLPMVGAPPVLAIATISIATGVGSVLALLVGHRLNKSLGRPAIAAGGVALVLIGTKILVEHLRA